jgi:L-alanine-DL-glutamate epimerase-like enolase superfamily enzyme
MRETEAILHAHLMAAEDDVERLRAALREARPYVFNRTQGDDWRAETARDVLSRVDAALSDVQAKSLACRVTPGCTLMGPHMGPCVVKSDDVAMSEKQVSDGE